MLKITQVNNTIEKISVLQYSKVVMIGKIKPLNVLMKIDSTEKPKNAT